MMLADRCKTIRRGVTLVELLIVVSIMTILAAIALPAMQTGMESRRIREAARAVHVYFGAAQVRALETGRSAGVMIERSDENPEAGVLLRQVEVPPPYAGDVDGATMRVWADTVAGPGIVRAHFPTAMPVSNGLISPGNRVQLNYQGPYYTIQLPSGTDFPVDADGYFDFTTLTDTTPTDGWADETLTLVVDVNQVNLPWPIAYPGTIVPFQITRGPVPSSVAPLSLPRGMVVDLGDSGSDQAGFPATGVGTGPLIMFSPDGQIERVFANGLGASVTSPIFLMIGRADRVGAMLPEDGLENWQDANNLWVALNPQTGRITVAEVHADLPPSDPANPTPDTYIPSNLYTSRTSARQAQISMGGR